MVTVHAMPNNFKYNDVDIDIAVLLGHGVDIDIEDLLGHASKVEQAKDDMIVDTAFALLAAAYWVRYHKPSYDDACALFRVLNRAFGLFYRGLGMLYGVFVVSSVKAIYVAYRCSATMIYAVSTCRTLVRCLTTVAFCVWWFAPAEYITVAFMVLMRINHVYARGAAIGFAAISFLRVLDRMASPWVVRLSTLRVVLNAVSPGTIVICAHACLAPVPFSLAQMLAALVVMMSWFIKGLHCRGRFWCTALSYVTMAPFCFTYSSTVHILIAMNLCVFPHLMIEPDTVVPLGFGEAEEVLGGDVSTPRAARDGPALCAEGQLAAPLSPLADEQCLYHCLAAAQNVLFYEGLPMKDKITAAYFIKAEFIEFLRGKGKTDLADRLGGKGRGSYPDTNDFDLLAEYLGGQIVVESSEVGDAGPIYFKAEHPRLVVLGHLMVADGAGQQAPHFELRQSYIAPVAKPSYITIAVQEEKLTNTDALRTRLEIPGASSNDDAWATKMQRFKEDRKKLSTYTPLPPGQDTSVVGSVNALFEVVDGSNPHWSDYKKRIAVALLALYKMKPAHCALTDHLKLLWIFLGEHFLRAHDGHCFFYEQDLGAFTTYHGVLPYSHFVYMRQICVHLEGLCREFPSGVERTDEGVLKAIETVFNRVSHGGKGGKGPNEGKGKGPDVPDDQFFDEYVFDADDEKLFAELLDNALFNKGNELLRRGGNHGKGPNTPKGGGKDGSKGDKGSAASGSAASGWAASGGKDGAKGFYHDAAADVNVANDDADDNAVSAPAVWHIGLAQAISRCSTSLQSELMGNKLLSLMVEWCSTPKPTSQGVAYKDFAYLYRDDATPLVPLRNRSPQNNIYVGMHQHILAGLGDPVLDAAIDRCWQIYSRTFWANADALTFCQSCLELAKRGCNVDQITIFLGPGGVGLSLYTAHIAAMLGTSLHRFFDPNVFYNDDELRKTVELLFGAIVFSGQERPTGSKSKLREDLLKKFVTAEGIAGRLPYGLVTRMIMLIGWKRLECNKLFRFDDITDDDIESVIRRCAVIRVMSKFYDKMVLEKFLPDHESYGIFAREPDAKTFLTSGPGLLAGLQIQHMFAEGTTVEELRANVQTYTRLGGDHGHTSKYIRKACGLPDRVHVGPDWNPLANAIDGPGSSQGGSPRLGLSDSRLKVIAEHYAKELIRFLHKTLVNDVVQIRTYNHLLPGFFKLLPNAPNVKTKDLDKLWNDLTESKYFAKVGDKEYLPLISIATEASVLWPFSDTDEEPLQTGFNESYDVANFSRVFQSHEIRLQNMLIMETLISALHGDNADAVPVKARRGRKRKNATAPVVVAEARGVAEADRLLARWDEKTVTSVKDLVSHLRHWAENADADGDTQRADLDTHSRRARISHKTPSSPRPPHAAEVSRAAESSMKRAVVNYARKHAWRTRRIADWGAAQWMPQLLQKTLLPHTLDVDVINCMLTLLPQIIGALGVDLEAWPEQVALLKKLAEDRDILIKEELRMNLAEGKETINAIINGSAIPPGFAEDDFVKSLQRLSVWLRIVAISACPDMFKTLSEDEECSWPAASTFAHMYQGAEDFILEAMVSYCIQFPRTHMSLHFDGIRVDERLVREAQKSAGGDEHDHEQFLTALEKHVSDRTGFTVRVKVKMHRFFMQTVLAYQPEDVGPLGPLYDLMQVGNCIPLALGRLIRGSADAAAIMNALRDPHAQQPRTRTYRECADFYDCVLVPVARPLLHTIHSKWLLHCEHCGMPHCMAVDALDGNTCAVFDGTIKRVIPISVIEETTNTCIDRRLIRRFRVYDKTDSEHDVWKKNMSIAALESLLDVRAGGVGDSDNADSDSRPPLDDATSDDTSIEEDPPLYPRDKVYDQEDESMVHVDMGLFHILLQEVMREYRRVTTEAKKHKRKRVGRHTRMDCRFCLFTDFPMTKTGYGAYLRHLKDKHIPSDANAISDEGTAEKEDSAFYVFIPKNRGGSRQLVLIKALFDSDSLKGCARRDYLWISTCMMAKVFDTVDIPARHKCYGRYIHIRLSHDGPHLFAGFSGADFRGLRRVGHFYYDESFVNAFFREAIVGHGRLKPLRYSFIQRACEVGNEVWCLLPTRTDTWCAILEDVLSSGRIVDEFTRLLVQCCENEEFTHVSMDATIRIARRIKGQGDYRMSKARRNAAVFGDDVALRRVLTMRGRTGAVAGMWCVRDESGPVTREALRSNLPASVLMQIQSIAFDDPKCSIFHLLRSGPCPNLRMLALDPFHLVINYLQAHNRKESCGSKFLRRIMNRWNKPLPRSVDLGQPFLGDDASPLTTAEAWMYARIEPCSFPLDKAQGFIDNFNDTEGYRTRFEFISALAALTSVFSSEVTLRTHVRIHGVGKKLSALLACAARPNRMEYYFNNLRLRQSMPAGHVAMLKSGTSSNEALHRDMNKWFKNQQELYIGTLRLQLQVSCFGRFVMHNAMLYTPQRRQYSEIDLLHAVAGSWRFGCAWTGFAAQSSSTTTLATRNETRAAIKQKSAPRRIFKKRPAASVVVAKHPKRRRPRCFNTLKRCRV